jgi:hypothetical protein
MRQQVKVILQGVAGIGRIHDYERYATRPEALKALFVQGGKLHGWTITREKTPAVYRMNLHTERHHRFVLRGYYALDDGAASEKTFQDLLEAIEVAFRSNVTLNDTAELAGPLQVERVTPVLFAGVLCHFAELSLEAQELVDITL